jgi:hypothetical protein
VHGTYWIFLKIRKYKNFIRISSTDSECLLNVIGPRVAKEDTTYRRAVSVTTYAMMQAGITAQLHCTVLSCDILRDPRKCPQPSGAPTFTSSSSLTCGHTESYVWYETAQSWRSWLRCWPIMCRGRAAMIPTMSFCCYFLYVNVKGSGCMAWT